MNDFHMGVSCKGIVMGEIKACMQLELDKSS